MKVWSILLCLVVLFIHGIFCDGNQDDQNSTIKQRTKRYHENDCQKRKSVDNKSNKPATPSGRTFAEQKPKIAPKTIIKSKLPINERNQPKDVRTINHILEEIATIAHNHNETKGVHKIRHLVDEIDNLDSMKSRAKVNDVKTPIRANRNEAKPKETSKLTQECNVVRKLPVNVENKESVNINVNKSLSTNGRRFNNELSKHADETTRMPNEHLIEIEEHKYEEELLRSPYKYNTYNMNLIKRKNNNGIPVPYDNSHIYEPDSSYSNTYPIATYGQYDGINGYYYTNGYYYINSPNQSNQQNFHKNEDYTRSRKTWLKDTIINARNINPNDLGKIINGARDDMTNIQSPEFYRKYYSVTQKQYSNNNEVLMNQLHYVNPFQCSK